MKVLALGAHPDDIEIFMFGTLAAYRAQGAEIHLAIATDGARGGKGDPAALAATRKVEARAAAAHLGAQPIFLDLPDGALVPDAALLGALKTVIGDIRPDVIISHAANDYHGDHRALSQAAAIAGSFTAPVLECDTLRGVGFVPRFYVETTAYRADKAAAIRAHASQDPERFVAAAEQQGRFRASQCNGGPDDLAEALRHTPVYPFADIRGLLPPAPRVRPVWDRSRQD